MATKIARIIILMLSALGSLFLLGVVIFMVFAGYLAHTVSSGVKDFSSSLGHVKGSLSDSSFVTPSDHTPYIAGVKLHGEINAATADEVIEKLNTANSDNDAIGILLDLSSPGGTVVPSQEIYDTVKDVATKKPVVVYVREMAASGAYYSSASATKIIANRGSIIGSIGVILSGFEADKLIQFLKINTVTIKTGELKDAGSLTRPMNDKDKKYLKGLIEATRAEFVADVQSSRHTTAETMKFMSDGRVVLAPEALSLKLIDSIGSKKVALDEIAKIAKIKKTPELFYYENTQPFNVVFAKKFLSNISHVLSETIIEVIKNSDSNFKIPKI